MVQTCLWEASGTQEEYKYKLDRVIRADKKCIVRDVHVNVSKLPCPRPVLYIIAMFVHYSYFILCI